VRNGSTITPSGKARSIERRSAARKSSTRSPIAATYDFDRSHVRYRSISSRRHHLVVTVTTSVK
jgi:hypothetical protein